MTSSDIDRAADSFSQLCGPLGYQFQLVAEEKRFVASVISEFAKFFWGKVRVRMSKKMDKRSYAEVLFGQKVPKYVLKLWILQN